MALLQISSGCPYLNSQRDNLWAMLALEKTAKARDLEVSLLDLVRLRTFRSMAVRTAPTCSRKIFARVKASRDSISGIVLA
jgi:hypothetical protein